MKKVLKRISIFVLCFILIVSAMPTYATESTEAAKGVIGNVLKAFLDILTWFGYAVALGALVFIGIKYVLSGANERANLKGMLPKYLIGIALIVMCFTIAQAVAELAGNDTAEEIIGVGTNP